jgi:hypothetical protein
MNEKILYGNITDIEIKNKKHFFGHILIHQRDGSVGHLYHVDSPELIVHYIQERKKHRGQSL